LDLGGQTGSIDQSLGAYSNVHRLVANHGTVLYKTVFFPAILNIPIHARSSAQITCRESSLGASIGKVLLHILITHDPIDRHLFARRDHPPD
jgi:hypothetical protein